MFPVCTIAQINISTAIEFFDYTIGLGVIDPCTQGVACVRACTQGGRWSNLLLLEQISQNNGDVPSEFLCLDQLFRSYLHAKDCVRARTQRG